MLQPLWNYIVSRFVMDLWLWYNVTPHISNYYCTILMVFFLLLQVLSMSRRGCPLIAVLKMHSTWQGLQGFLQTGLTRQRGLFCPLCLVKIIWKWFWHDKEVSAPPCHINNPFHVTRGCLHLSIMSVIHFSMTRGCYTSLPY